MAIVMTSVRFPPWILHICCCFMQFYVSKVVCGFCQSDRFSVDRFQNVSRRDHALRIGLPLTGAWAHDVLVCPSCNALLRAPSANCLFGGESHDSFGRRTEAGLDLDLMEQKKYLSTSRIRVRLRLPISHGNPGFGSTIANLQNNFFVLLTQSSNLRYSLRTDAHHGSARKCRKDATWVGTGPFDGDWRCASGADGHR